MPPQHWSAHTDWETVCKRASGRRRYNSVRHLHMELRRIQVFKLLREGHRQMEIVKQLGVDPATICRDVYFLLIEGHSFHHTGLP